MYRNKTSFSDAKSVLETLENEIGKKDKIIWKFSRNIGEVIAAHHGINITFQWIPGHTNIQGKS